MSPDDIASEIKEILEKNSGRMRTTECMKEFAKNNVSKKRRFYRWRRKVENGKVKGFNVLKFLDNISYICLDSAELRCDESERFKKSRGFFTSLTKWIKERNRRKELERKRLAKELLAKKWTYLELVAKVYPEAEICKDWVEIEQKNRKELGLD